MVDRFWFWVSIAAFVLGMVCADSCHRAADHRATMGRADAAIEVLRQRGVIP
jgi:hypothetical protein